MPWAVRLTCGRAARAPYLPPSVDRQRARPLPGRSATCSQWAGHHLSVSLPTERGGKTRLAPRRAVETSSGQQAAWRCPRRMPVSVATARVLEVPALRTGSRARPASLGGGGVRKRQPPGAGLAVRAGVRPSVCNLSTCGIRGSQNSVLSLSWQGRPAAHHWALSLSGRLEQNKLLSA